jgi:hypothetical protein
MSRAMAEPAAGDPTEAADAAPNEPSAAARLRFAKIFMSPSRSARANCTGAIEAPA